MITVKSAEQYNEVISAGKPTVVFFTASWADQCKQVQDVLEDLVKLLNDKLQIVTLEAEDFAEISLKHQVSAVPTVIFFNNGSAVDRVDGLDIAALTEKCNKLAKLVKSDIKLEDRLKALINKAAIMIFMKGHRDAPRCGFSKQLIAILNETGLTYETFDILGDEEVRQGLKEFSDWPTYPQVYVKGELIGGLDIIKELKVNGELDATLRG